MINNMKHTSVAAQHPGKIFNINMSDILMAVETDVGTTTSCAFLSSLTSGIINIETICRIFLYSARRHISIKSVAASLLTFADIVIGSRAYKITRSVSAARQSGHN